MIAVVGTRAADDTALRAAREIAIAACQAGFAVVSGGAMGVDAAAHQGALEIGGRTVAVMAGAVDSPGPARNSRLFAAMIGGGGALWSERPAGSKVVRASFPQRNRLIAAAAAAVVVVQARERSGSLSTAEHASRLGRPLLAVPGRWRDESRAGCNALLSAGACVVASPEDLLRHLDRLGISRPRPVEQVPLLAGPSDPAEAAVLQALESGAHHADEVARATGLSARAVLVAISALELSGRWRP